MKRLSTVVVLAAIVLSMFPAAFESIDAYDKLTTGAYVVDAPHRVSPGENIPVLAMLYSVPQVPLGQERTLKRIEIWDIGFLRRNLVEAHEINERIDEAPWHRLYTPASDAFKKGRGDVVTVTVKFVWERMVGATTVTDTVDKLVKVRVAQNALPSIPGWHAGDGHLHSSMTDNHLEFGPPVDAITAAARAIGLDWVIITDHGHDIEPFPGQWDEYKEICAQEQNTIPGEFICMLGEEITVKYGDDRDSSSWGSHYLAYGISSPIEAPDWGPNVQRCPTAQEAIDAVVDQGGVGFIAHPFNWIRPWQDWTVEGYTGIEIWNSALDDDDGEAMAKWHELLRSHREVFGIGNSDAHDIVNIGRHVRSYVYLGDADLSESSVIDAMRKGRIVVTDGPLLTFSVEDHLVGEMNVRASDYTVNLNVSWKSSPEYGAVRNVVVSMNGEPVEFYVPTEAEKFEGTRSNWSFRLPSTRFSYFTVWCRTSEGKLAYTNPIRVYVPPLHIMTPTSSKPACAGDPGHPDPITVSVKIPSYLLNPYMMTPPALSVSIGGQDATFELVDEGKTHFGIFTMKVHPPKQASEGLYDLSVTADFDDFCAFDTQPEAVQYVTAPSTEPIDMGLAWLRTRQYADGSWRDSVGVTSLAVLAFLNAGYDETDATVSKAINYILARVRADGSIYGTWYYATYETSLAMLPLVATRNAAYSTIIENAKNWLVNSQWDESCLWGSVSKDNWYYGGFGYGYNVRPDLSNTQFALLALDAAGLPQDDPLWTKAQVFLHRCQNIGFPITLNIDGVEYTVQPHNHAGGYDGGFIYYPGTSLAGSQRSYGSMTGAGIWGLLLSGVPKTDARVVAAMNWVEHNYTWDTNPVLGWNWPYYYYVTMSKALTMFGKPLIDGHDWYQELYDKLIGMQVGAGSGQGYWSTTSENFNPDLTTAYAILSIQTRAIAAPEHHLPYLTFILRSNCNIRVTDPEGRLVGYDYMAGQGENQIPAAVYSGPFFEPQYIVVVNPKAGTYRLELFGVSEGSYELTIQAKYGDEITDISELSGEIKPGELHGASVIVTSIVGPINIYADPPQFEEYIDNIPPTTTLEIGESAYVDPLDDIYVSSATPFALTAEDNPGGTGVSNTFYCIYNSTYDTGWLEYSEPFHLTGLPDGRYSIEYYSTDNAGNAESANIIAVSLVSLASWSHVTISSTAGGSVTAPGVGAFTYPEGTVIELVAIPDADHYFVGWTGDVDEIATVNSAETIITMHGDLSITANFAERKVEATVAIDPETMNLQASSKWITAYIGLPDEYAVDNIDIGTVHLLYDVNSLDADWGDVQDGVFMAKFDWATVAGWLEGRHDEYVEFIIAGEVEGVHFEGTATIRVIDPPRPRRGR